MEQKKIIGFIGGWGARGWAPIGTILLTHSHTHTCCRTSLTGGGKSVED